MPLRYVLQGAVMFGDVLVFIAAAILLWTAPDEPLIWLMLFLGFRSWKKVGGFEVWRKKGRAQFMRNAKSLGI